LRQALKSNVLENYKAVMVFGFDTIAVHFQHRKILEINKPKRINLTGWSLITLIDSNANLSG